MSKRSTFNKPLRSSALTAGTLSACLLLAGCPTASNPTQPQSPSSAATPPAAGGLPGGAAGDGAGTSGDESANAGTPGGAAEGGGESPSGSLGDAPSDSPPGGGPEPGFGDDVAAAQGLPDLRDMQTTRESNAPGALSSANGGGPATAGDVATGAGQTGGTDSEAVATGGAGTDSGADGVADDQSEGPLTPAERVAVLDGELARSTGEFDALIVKTQAAQREAARSEIPTASGTAATGGDQSGESSIEGGLADAGGYSTGGGMGGTAGGGIPTDSAKYPPPSDIPSGNDDDVVARQLREAAMREPDPAVRERLWDEYRKYKGITP